MCKFQDTPALQLVYIANYSSFTLVQPLIVLQPFCINVAVLYSAPPIPAGIHRNGTVPYALQYSTLQKICTMPFRVNDIVVKQSGMSTQHAALFSFRGFERTYEQTRWQVEAPLSHCVLGLSIEEEQGSGWVSTLPHWVWGFCMVVVVGVRWCSSLLLDGHHHLLPTLRSGGGGQSLALITIIAW